MFIQINSKKEPFKTLVNGYFLLYSYGLLCIINLLKIHGSRLKFKNPRLSSSCPERYQHILNVALRQVSVTQCNHPPDTHDYLVNTQPNLQHSQADILEKSITNHLVLAKMVLAALRHKPPNFSSKILLFICMKYRHQHFLCFV